jgi:hypothetical protein
MRFYFANDPKVELFQFAFKPASSSAALRGSSPYYPVLLRRRSLVVEPAPNHCPSVST